MKNFDLKFLDECFDIDFESGQIRWKLTRPLEHFSNRRGWINWHNKNPGKLAGHIDANGYMGLKLTIDGKECNLKHHRIIYALYHLDTLPPIIDHFDGDRTNNAISNLRPSSKQENPRNRKVSIKNKSGITGIKKMKDRKNLWRASVIVDGKTITKTSADFFELCCFRKSWELKLGIKIRT